MKSGMFPTMKAGEVPDFIGVGVYESCMPRYFIDADDGDFPHRDDEGHDLPDDHAARRAVLDALPDMARDKLPDGDDRTFVVTARDEQGKVIYEAVLSLHGGWGPQPRS